MLLQKIHVNTVFLIIFAVVTIIINFFVGPLVRFMIEYSVKKNQETLII